MQGGSSSEKIRLAPCFLGRFAVYCFAAPAPIRSARTTTLVPSKVLWLCDYGRNPPDAYMLWALSYKAQYIETSAIRPHCNFQKTGKKPNKTRTPTSTSGLFGLSYAQSTKTHSNAFSSGCFSANCGSRKTAAGRKNRESEKELWLTREKS
jgi:hypothetical protein